MAPVILSDFQNVSLKMSNQSAEKKLVIKV